MSECYFFGCWNEAGHFLHLPGGERIYRHQAERYGSEQIDIDGTLAPRRGGGYGDLCWMGQGKTHDERMRIDSRSGAYPQGQFLLHHIDNGYTAISWWDRCQGDSRGACNSTVLLKGQHTSEEMLAALREHFPHVVENLTKAGVALIEVQRAKDEGGGK